VVATVKMPGAAAGDPEVDLNPMEETRIESFRRVCRLRVGLTPGDSTTVLPGPLPVGGGGVSQSASSGTTSSDRTIKPSSIVDQTLDAPIKSLPPGAIRQMFTDYKAARGAFPSEDIEPTADQISAVAQILAADAAPYADFAIFGPHGKRLLQKLVFVSFVSLPDGTWQKREMPGPPSFEVWWQSWRVLRTTLLLLNAADPEHLDNYAEHLRALHNNYGPECWFILYTADVRMRSEQFERIRRRLEEAHKSGASGSNSVAFEQNRPWNSVFAESVLDKFWWDDNMRDRALKYLAKIKTGADAVDDGTTQPGLRRPSESVGSHKRGSRSVSQITTPSTRAEERESWAEKDQNGIYVKNHKGNPICRPFNENRCGKPGGVCPNGDRHQCSICLGTHSKADHDALKSGALQPTSKKRKRKGN
jgi:hypothetical protein